MKNNSTIIALGIIFIFLLPTPMGRFFIDMAGGLVILILLLTLVFSGLIWVSWRNIKSNLKTCNSCGSAYVSQLSQCPICGSDEQVIDSLKYNNIPASSVTIDVEAEQTD